MEETELGPVSPMFIVGKLSESVRFYTERLGFELRYSAPEDEPFFAIVGRDSAQIFLKEIGKGVDPMPNPSRHEWAAWDGFVYVTEPERLAAEFESNGLELTLPVSRREDGLRGFQISDADGYVLYFGRPDP